MNYTKLSDKALAFAAQHQANMHAIQSGVAQMQHLDPEGATSPKHLRVGVNSALLETGALQAVLFNKGIITPDEYFEALADLSAREVKQYEERLMAHYGGNVKITLA